LKRPEWEDEMISPTGSADVTVRDVLDGLEAMEKWTRQLREALATLDQEQRLDVRHPLVAAVPLVSGGRCPPPVKPKPKKKQKKTK
jgi:hypothetical protein